MNASVNLYGVCPFYAVSGDKLQCKDPGQLSVEWKWGKRPEQARWMREYCWSYDYTRCPMYQAMAQRYEGTR